MKSPLKLAAIVLATSIVLSAAVIGTTKLATGSDNIYDASDIVIENVNPDWKDHTVVGDPAVAPGCTSPGKTEGAHCSDCAEILLAQLEVPAKGHDITMEQPVYEIEEDAGEIAVRAVFQCVHAEVTALSWEISDTETVEMLSVAAEPASDRSTAVFVPKKTGVVTVKARTADDFTPEQSATILVHSKDRLLLPEGVAAVTAGMFSGCDAEEIVIPEGVTRIEANAFVNCPNLKIVVLPDSLQEISPEAFEKTEGITIVCSPDSVGAQFAGGSGAACLLFETEVRMEYAEPTEAPVQAGRDNQSGKKKTDAPEKKPTATVRPASPSPTTDATNAPENQNATAAPQATQEPATNVTDPSSGGGESSKPENNTQASSNPTQEPSNPTQAPSNPTAEPSAKQGEGTGSGGNSQGGNGGEPAKSNTEAVEAAAEAEGGS